MSTAFLMIVRRSVESPELSDVWSADTIADSICWFKLLVDAVVLDAVVLAVDAVVFDEPVLLVPLRSTCLRLTHR